MRSEQQPLLEGEHPNLEVEMHCSGRGVGWRPVAEVEKRLETHCSMVPGRVGQRKLLSMPERIHAKFNAARAKAWHWQAPRLTVRQVPYLSVGRLRWQKNAPSWPPQQLASVRHLPPRFEHLQE